MHGMGQGHHWILALVKTKTEFDVYKTPECRIALPRARLPKASLLSGGRLDPVDGFPVIWRFTPQDGGRPMQVLNVLGLLNGGAISISIHGTLYETRDRGRLTGLYLPGVPKTVTFGEKPPKVLSPEKYKKPLFPSSWPTEAVAQVVRHRFRPLVILEPSFFLAQIHRLAPSSSAQYDASREDD